MTEGGMRIRGETRLQKKIFTVSLQKNSVSSICAQYSPFQLHAKFRKDP